MDKVWGLIQPIIKEMLLCFLLLLFLTAYIFFRVTFLRVSYSLDQHLYTQDFLSVVNLRKTVKANITSKSVLLGLLFIFFNFPKIIKKKTLYYGKFQLCSVVREKSILYQQSSFKIIKELPWWCSGTCLSCLPVKGTWVQSLIQEIPLAMEQLSPGKASAPQLLSPCSRAWELQPLSPHTATTEVQAFRA